MRLEAISYRDVLLLCLVWAMLGALVWHMYFESKPPVVHTDSRKSSYDKPDLVEYVYKNSYRISRATATSIVDMALRTKYPLLMLAVMKVESNYNPAALSRTGARGLGQVMPMHIKVLKKQGIISDGRQLFNVKSNIKAMEYIFGKKLKKARGNYILALKYYFGADNKKYVEKVLDAYLELAETGGGKDGK